jgi:hypothetical protein
LVNLAQNVYAHLKEDPIAGREMLRNLLGEGMMKLTPNGDGSYEVESSLIWDRLSWKTRKPRRGSGPAGAPEVVGNDGCAGPLADLYTRHEVVLFVRTKNPPDRRRMPETWRRRATA